MMTGCHCFEVDGLLMLVQHVLVVQRVQLVQPVQLVQRGSPDFTNFGLQENRTIPKIVLLLKIVLYRGIHTI